MSMDKYQNRYRIASTRMSNWDYGSNAGYFVTLCTRNRAAYFGDIQNGVMQLSRIGQMAHDYWQAILQHFEFIVLDAFVVMPNHVHGIIIIDKTHDMDIGRDAINNIGRDAINRVSTGGVTGKHNPMWHHNLSRMIRWYKGRVSFESRKITPDFAWQPRFHDHIIRNEGDYQRIMAYIQNNPFRWQEDEYHLSNSMMSHL